MIPCAGCGSPLDKPVAAMSGSIMGDEESEAWYYCATCAVYTRSRSRDRFHGEDETRRPAAFSKEKGDAQVAVIRRCAEPWNKSCRCDAHREYFGPWLD